METEYQVLTHLHENARTSQRALSRHTGLSLGAVNILLKRMARKGLIKMEKLNARSVRYILTPQGIKEKTRLTYQFVRRSYQQILEITAAVEELITLEQKTNGTEEVILYGPADEIEAILKNTLTGMRIKPLVRRPEEDGYNPQPGQLVLTWRHEDEEKLPPGSGVVNVMNLV